MHAARALEARQQAFDLVAFTPHRDFGAVVFLGALAQFLERAVADDAAPVDDHDPVRGGLDLLEDVGGEDHGPAAGEPPDQLADLDDLVRVQAGSGFVEDDDLRVVYEGLGQGGALAVSLGKFTYDLAVHGFKPTFLQHHVGAFAEFRAAEAPRARHEVQVRPDFHVHVQGKHLGQVPDDLAHAQRILEHVHAPDGGRAARGVEIGRQDLHGRRFARAIGAEQADNLALLHLERHTIQRPHGPIVHCEVLCLDHVANTPEPGPRAPAIRARFSIRLFSSRWGRAAPPHPVPPDRAGTSDRPMTAIPAAKRAMIVPAWGYAEEALR